MYMNKNPVMIQLSLTETFRLYFLIFIIYLRTYIYIFNHYSVFAKSSDNFYDLIYAPFRFIHTRVNYSIYNF